VGDFKPHLDIPRANSSERNTLYLLISFITYSLASHVICVPNFYNIASRSAQSISVYVSVLKMPIVHADGVSESIHQKIFFRASGH